MKKKPLHLKSYERAFQGSRFDVLIQEVPAPSGKPHKREVIIHPGAVVLLPIVDPHSIILIRNERFVVGETLWELPAGTLEPGESPDQTARRELIEETGYECAGLKPLTTFYSSPGICNEVLYAYVAEDLSFVGQNLDECEKITVETLPWPQVLQMIQNHEIRDGKSLATLLYYHAFYR